MRTLTLLALALLATLPLAAGSTTYTYVAGSHEPTTGYGIVCTGQREDPVATPVAGGVCFAEPTDIGSFTITVVDALGDPVGFKWMGMDDAIDNGCGFGGTAFGSVTLSLAEPCDSVNVFPDAGALAGTITVS